MTRIAFTLIGRGPGTGLYDYLLNLIGLICEHAYDSLHPVLLVGYDAKATDVEPFCRLPGVEVVKSPALDGDGSARAVVEALVWGEKAGLGRLLGEQRVDLLFESARFYGWRLSCPVIAWIPDFQHRHLPHLFSRAGYLKRELGFRVQVATGRRFMLSSDDSRKACELFYPSTVGRTRTVRFAVPPQPTFSLSECRGIADTYGLPKRYFYIPNQFSKHKNHRTVAEALVLLREQGTPACVAASGMERDERDPYYFAQLKREIQRCSASDDFKLLGLVPRQHVTALMRASTALINPSLFEGWSTPVEQARSLGVPMLLSDLPVHREQADSAARFFERHSASSLAEAINCFPHQDGVTKEASFHEAQRGARERAREFVRQFALYAQECAGAVASLRRGVA